jgi:hypothetical protein
MMSRLSIVAAANIRSGGLARKILVGVAGTLP